MKKLPARWWDWPSVILLVIMLTIAAARLWVTAWTPKLGLTQTAALIGCVLGLALGYSRFQRRSLWLLVLGYSLVSLPWLWLGISTSKESALQRLASVGGRLSAALSAISARQPVEDYFFFVALMTVLFWIMALFSGYQLTRKTNLLAVILPAGVGMVIIELYDFIHPDRIAYLGFYLLLSLLLLGRYNLINNKARWLENNFATASDTSMDISTGIVIAACALLIAAWLIPLNGFTFAPVENAWHQVDAQFESTRQRIRDALAAVQNYIPSGGGISFGSEMSLGRTAAQGDAIIFRVEAATSDRPRHYWRARVYDDYLNGKWTNSYVKEINLSPDQTAFLAPSDRTLDKTSMVVIVNQPQSTLITINDPLWVSRDTIAILNYTGTTATDLIALRVVETLRNGERYEIDSAVRSPTLRDLRDAGAGYPEWLRERYLQLPDNFSQRIQKLAEKITANAETPYDKAAAITDYLRTNITYTETIHSSDPFGGDPIAWMLFSSHQGFCNYYASAEVLMLRAVGVPARLAVGYAEGARVSGQYQVRSKDAHAWPEVYFPGLGWVEFEPTTAQPSINRPSGETVPLVPGVILRPTPVESDGGEPDLPETNNSTPVTTSSQLIQRLTRWVIIFLIVGTWTGFLIFLSRRQPLSVRIPRALAKFFGYYRLNVPGWLQDWLRWTEQTESERSFETINRCLWLLGKSQPVYATPSERAATLSSLLPEAAAAIEQLTQKHIGALFSPAKDTTQSTWRTTFTIYLVLFRHYFVRQGEKS